ncbi:hypothetical protein HRbin35_00650 [bacterium HR35]|nr:hypothetical protein HRbin35_00650 [bacterium HR35]
MARSKSYIYLEGKEELGDIIFLVCQKTIDKEIVLVVPVGFRVFKNLHNLEVLKKEIISCNKKVYIDSSDQEILKLCQEVGLEIFLETFSEEEKKIFDIKPPQKVKAPLQEKTLPPKEELPVSQIRKEKRKTFFSNFNLLVKLKKALIFLFLIFLFYFSLNLILGFIQTKANLRIVLDKSEIDLNEIITLKESAVQLDSQNKILPAQRVKIEKNLSEVIEPSGRETDEFLPNLKVFIYNKLPYAYPLVEGTRLGFQDNVFKTIKRINLEAGSEEKPSQTLVEAFPFDLKDKNLFLAKGTKLSILALEGKKIDENKLWSDYLYAEVAEDYKPQESQNQVKVVTQEDLTNLRLKLEDKIKKELQGELLLKYPTSYVIYDDVLVSSKITSISNNVGEKTDKLSGLIEGKIETYIINRNELEKLMKEIVFNNLKENQNQFLLEKLTINSISLLDYDFKQGTMRISVKGKAILYPNLSSEILKNLFKGVKIDEVEKIVKEKNLKGIKSIYIKIWPNWRDRLPTDPQRIEINFE